MTELVSEVGIWLSGVRPRPFQARRRHRQSDRQPPPMALALAAHAARQVMSTMGGKRTSDRPCTPHFSKGAV